MQIIYFQLVSLFQQACLSPQNLKVYYTYNNTKIYYCLVMLYDVQSVDHMSVHPEVVQNYPELGSVEHKAGADTLITCSRVN